MARLTRRRRINIRTFLLERTPLAQSQSQSPPPPSTSAKELTSFLPCKSWLNPFSGTIAVTSGTTTVNSIFRFRSVLEPALSSPAVRVVCVESTTTFLLPLLLTVVCSSKSPSLASLLLSSPPQTLSGLAISIKLCSRLSSCSSPSRSGFAASQAAKSDRSDSEEQSSVLQIGMYYRVF